MNKRNFENLRWVLRGVKWTGAAVAVVSSGGGAFFVPLIAKEVAEEFLLSLGEEGIGEILGVTVEAIASEGVQTFIVGGAETALSQEETLAKLGMTISKPLSNAFSALATLGLGAGQVSHARLMNIQNNEQLAKKEVDEAYYNARKFIDDTPLSRIKRENCDNVLEKLNEIDGVYKAIGIRWLFEKDVNSFFSDLSNLGDEVIRDIKTTLLQLEIDITSRSPLYS